MTSIERTARAVIVGLALLSLPAPAFAKNPEAIVHFELGRKFVREGRWKEAATEFEKSLALEQAVGPLLNLANAYEKLGRLSAAVKTFRSAEELAARTPGDEARATEAAGRAREIEEKLPSLSIAAEANVSLEIENVGSVQPNVATTLDPGRHVLIASAPGKRSRKMEIVLAEREKRKITVPLLEDESARPSPSTPSRPESPPATSPPPESSSSNVIAYGLVGTGVVGLVVGGAFGLVAMNDKSELLRLCPKYPSCPLSSADAVREVDDTFVRNATISTIGFVAGGVLVAAGIAYYFIAPRGPNTASLRVTPGIAAARLELSF